MGGQYTVTVQVQNQRKMLATHKLDTVDLASKLISQADTDQSPPTRPDPFPLVWPAARLSKIVIQFGDGLAVFPLSLGVVDGVGTFPKWKRGRAKGANSEKFCANMFRDLSPFGWLVELRKAGSLSFWGKNSYS